MVALFHAAVDVVFTSDTSSPFVISVAGAFITIWGILVLVMAGPASLARHGKMVRLYDGPAVTGFVPATRTGWHEWMSSKGARKK